jgi:hypothetical protein
MNASVFKYNDDAYYLKQILGLFCHSYNELKTDKLSTPYSRESIHNQIIKIKGKKAKLELEDYLRNDLVQSYVNKGKKAFNIENYKFLTGIEETNEFVSTGNLDIKVLLPTSSFVNEEPYLIFECKRINKLKAKKDYYITGGIERFTNRQYYPTHNAKVGIMLAFAEMEILSQKEDFNLIVGALNDKIKTKSYNIKELTNCDLKYNNTIAGTNIFDSVFKRIDDTNILLIHLLLDYYDIILD